MTDELAQPSEARLSVDAAAMAIACDAFRKFLKTKKDLGDALLAFQEGKLRVETGGMAQSVPATGNWPGDARISSQFILGLVGLPPTGEVVFIVADGKLLLRLGGTTITRPCVWETSPRPAELLPMNAGLREKVAFGFAHGDEDIERLGLSPLIRPAMEKTRALIATAARNLEPFGVSEADLRELVQSRVSERLK